MTARELASREIWRIRAKYRGRQLWDSRKKIRRIEARNSVLMAEIEELKKNNPHLL